MLNSRFSHVKMIGIKTIIPPDFVDIDFELNYFNNDVKKLNRAKKIIGYGRRYLAGQNVTVVDLAVQAAQELFKEIQYDKNEIDLLIFANQKPDYREPCDACIAHGLLGLSEKCASLDLLMGCSGYVYALWSAMGMISSGAVKKCLILAGDIASFMIEPSNRKLAPLFGDGASATILEYDEHAEVTYFNVGTDGANWDKIVTPFGGIRLCPTKEELDLSAEDSNGNIWHCRQPMMKGEDVFNFTMTTVPASIVSMMDFANVTVNDVDFFALHQANKQIVEAVANKAGIPLSKCPSETFTSYGNQSTNSVPSVICDQLYNKVVNKTVLCSFGIGLSWATCLIHLRELYNGGISFYKNYEKKLDRKQQIDYWIKYFKGEDNDN